MTSLVARYATPSKRVQFIQQLCSGVRTRLPVEEGHAMKRKLTKKVPAQRAKARLGKHLE